MISEETICSGMTEKDQVSTYQAHMLTRPTLANDTYHEADFPRWPGLKGYV